jgi:hypothetical protein
MDIALTIAEAVDEAEQQGIIIVTDRWGIRNVEHKWICLASQCCPLGAVLLKHNLTFPESHFLYNPPTDLRNVRFNPSYSIIKLFDVEPEWINSFFHCLFNSRVCYYGDQVARDLGLEYFQKYGPGK